MSKPSLKKSKPFEIRMYPFLKLLCGRRFFKGCLILNRLEYWFARYPQGFCKPFEPYTRQEERSWQEETGFSRRVFLKAFLCFGIRYKSKSDYLAQPDPFQGKMYVIYYDRKVNRNYFFRNHSLVDRLLSS